jgi:hypothetical protein
MKKTVIAIIAGVILCSLYTYANAANETKFSKNFMKHFKDCDRYEETTTSTFEDRDFTTNRKIIGWRNGYCKYEEKISSPIDQYILRCSFNEIQVDELYEAMKSRSKEQEKYELEIFAESVDEKTGRVKYTSGGTETIKGNKAYIAWTKVQNNPYFCRPQKVK